MIPDKKTVLFVLGLAAVITIVAHLLLTSAKEKKVRASFERAHDGLASRTEVLAPQLRKMLAEKPRLLIELGKLGSAAADSVDEFAFLHPQTSEIVAFRVPRNVQDPARAASTIAAFRSPLFTAYDPTNGAASTGLILHVVPMSTPAK